MVENLRFLMENGHFMSYDMDGIEEYIPLEDLQLEWVYCSTEDWIPWTEFDYDSFEGGTAKVLDDNQILITVVIAQGQSGVVFIWDAYERKIVHISNGSFAVAATADDRWVYTLCMVEVYGVQAHLKLRRARRGTRDFEQSETVACTLPFTLDQYDANRDDFEMDIVDNTIEFRMPDGVYEMHLDE